MFEIGPSLREARLHKGVEIPDAERATKIRAKYLRALETESFDVLPGPGVHQELPPVVRGLPRPRRAALRGRVHVAVLDRRGARAPSGRDAFASGSTITGAPNGAWSGSPSSASPSSRRSSSPPGTTAAAGTTPASIPNLTPAVQPHVQQNQAVFVARAATGASLLEVRKGGVTGDVLFQGTLEKGEKQRFVGKAALAQRRHARRTSSSRSAGRRRRWAAGCPQVVTVTRKQVTSVSSCG